MNMDVMLCDEDYKGGTSPKPSLLKRILDFVESGLPLGMDLLKCRNFLYMFDGVYPSDHPYYYIYSREVSQTYTFPKLMNDT